LFDFVSKRKWSFLASGIVIFIGIIALIVSGLNLGLDFKPGTTMTLIFEEPVELSELQSAFADLGYPDVAIQGSPKEAFLFEDLPEEAQVALVDGLQSSLATTIRLAEFDSSGDTDTLALIVGKSLTPDELAGELAQISYGNSTFGNTTFDKTTLDSYLVRTGEQEQQVVNKPVTRLPVEQMQSANDTATEPPDEQLSGNQTAPVLPGQQRIKETMVSHFGDMDYLEYSTISAAVSSERVSYTIWAVIVAAIGILLYVGWAFRKLAKSFRFGVCAIIALIHDVLIVLSIFALFRLEVNAMFIIAELTVIGYSVNNTIVIFDRIRENRIRYVNLPFHMIVNRSLNETIVRSLNTSLTTLFVLLALFLFGGETINNFVLALIIGVIAGTYSSLLIASQLVIVWESGELQKYFDWIPVPWRNR